MHLDDLYHSGKRAQLHSSVRLYLLVIGLELSPNLSTFTSSQGKLMEARVQCCCDTVRGLALEEDGVHFRQNTAGHAKQEMSGSSPQGVVLSSLFSVT